MRRLLPFAAACGLTLTLAFAAATEAGISTSTDRPVQGEPTRVMVDVDGTAVSGAVVTAVYRPGSEVSKTVDIGTTTADGSVEWIPEDAGVVTLSAADQSQNVSVQFAGLPLPGLLILLLAGIVLYGGVIRGFRMLAGAPPPELPPDT